MEAGNTDAKRDSFVLELACKLAVNSLLNPIFSPTGHPQLAAKLLQMQQELNSSDDSNDDDPPVLCASRRNRRSVVRQSEVMSDDMELSVDESEDQRGLRIAKSSKQKSTRNEPFKKSSSKP